MMESELTKTVILSRASRGGQWHEVLMWPLPSWNTITLDRE
jgi:hypothetical protein